MKNYLYWNGKKTYSVQLRTISSNKKFLKGFIRGYFDCDGHSSKDAKRISICSVSKAMIDQIYHILIMFNFIPKYYTYHEKRPNMKDLYTLTLTGERAKYFINFVEPRNSIRIRNWGCPDSDRDLTHL